VQLAGAHSVSMSLARFKIAWVYKPFHMEVIKRLFHCLNVSADVFGKLFRWQRVPDYLHANLGLKRSDGIFQNTPESLATGVAAGGDYARVVVALSQNLALPLDLG